MLLFFCSVCLLVLLFVNNQRIRKSVLLVTSGASFIFVVVHWLVEGYRIQLIFLYGFIILMFIISLIGMFIEPKVVQNVSRMRRVLSGLFIGIGLMATGCLLYVFPVFNLLVPTGELKVGTQAFHFIDSSREETFQQTAKGKRELMVQIWYPAQAGTGHYASFIPDTEILRYMAGNYGLPGFTFKHLQYVSNHAYLEAEVSTKQKTYPLIIASPGFGSSRFLHTTQAEHLASHGYIVAVIDHTYNTLATEFPDGRITTDTTNDLFSPDQDYRESRTIRDKLGEVLTNDVIFTLDQFELIQTGQIPSNLKGSLDLGHIGVFGHSIGGATAYDASYDPRIAVGIDLDGGLYRLNDREGLQKPFMFINSESYFEKLKMVMENRVYTDEELKRMGSTREWEDQVTEDKKLELDRMRLAADEGGQILYIENTEHLNFTDVQFISPMFNLLGITGKIAPQRANSVINAYMLDFFDLYLKHQNGALMKGPNSLFPEMNFVKIDEL